MEFSYLALCNHFGGGGLFDDSTLLSVLMQLEQITLCVTTVIFLVNALIRNYFFWIYQFKNNNKPIGEYYKRDLKKVIQIFNEL